MGSSAELARRGPLDWSTVVIAVAGVAVALWAIATEWGGILHGHPVYVVLLGVTVVGASIVGALALRRRTRSGGVWRMGGRIILLTLGLGWIALMAWLRPHTAVEPSLSAMESDATVAVTETATEIVITPVLGVKPTGVFFQPGALVDARAYAAVLRPLADAGYTVVIPKQPLGIAFLALGAFDGARGGHPDITGWVVAGHSLGGTVAALEADAADEDGTAPSVGLLFYASYPAGDISSTLTIPVESISGTRDGLATPAKIAQSRATLPADTDFTVVDGASHAQFGDYGTQAGDNVPEISHTEARGRIAEASVAFVRSISG